jgi:hypothetical protein
MTLLFDVVIIISSDRGRWKRLSLGGPPPPVLSVVSTPSKGTTTIVLNRLSPAVRTGDRLSNNGSVMVGMRVGTGDGPKVVVVVVGYHEGNKLCEGLVLGGAKVGTLDGLVLGWMWITVGERVGSLLGVADGDLALLGLLDRTLEGTAEGCIVGGATVGLWNELGTRLGLALGLLLCIWLGVLLSPTLGARLAVALGLALGVSLGMLRVSLGLTLGARLGVSVELVLG